MLLTAFCRRSVEAAHSQGLARQGPQASGSLNNYLSFDYYITCTLDHGRKCGGMKEKERRLESSMNCSRKSTGC